MWFVIHSWPENLNLNPTIMPKIYGSEKDAYKDAIEFGLNETERGHKYTTAFIENTF